MVVEFDDRESASIKSFAVKNLSSIKATSNFISGKLLMYAKLSLKSFIYDLIETFCFPGEKVKEIFLKVWDREGGNFSCTNRHGQYIFEIYIYFRSKQWNTWK